MRTHCGNSKINNITGRWWGVVLLLATVLMVCGALLCAQSGVPTVLQALKAASLPRLSIVGLFRDNQDYVRCLSSLLASVERELRDDCPI